MVNDKDINGVLALMPRHATYYFTQASVTRALDSQSLQALALQHGLIGTPYPTVEAATRAALVDAHEEDFIYVGGSSFVVADLLTDFDKLKNIVSNHIN
jgi:dihydrofolate synthase/folylpolyglutamate synthase